MLRKAVLGSFMYVPPSDGIHQFELHKLRSCAYGAEAVDRVSSDRECHPRNQVGNKTFGEVNYS